MDTLNSPEALARGLESKHTKSAAYRSAGVPFRSQAISAFCADCIYDPGAKGSWKAQVKNCESRACPLWPYRPGADPITEMPGHTASTLKTVLANKRKEWRPV